MLWRRKKQCQNTVLNKYLKIFIEYPSGMCRPNVSLLFEEINLFFGTLRYRSQCFFFFKFIILIVGRCLIWANTQSLAKMLTFLSPINPASVLTSGIAYFS